jgi:hypothetical protein
LHTPRLWTTPATDPPLLFTTFQYEEPEQFFCIFLVINTLARLARLRFRFTLGQKIIGRLWNL